MNVLCNDVSSESTVTFKRGRIAPSPPSEVVAGWAETSEIEPDGRPPAQSILRPKAPAADRTSKRRSAYNRSPTITFGDIAIPPRFIGNVGHGFRGRTYVSTCTHHSISVMLVHTADKTVVSCLGLVSIIFLSSRPSFQFAKADDKIGANF